MFIKNDTLKRKLSTFSCQWYHHCWLRQNLYVFIIWNFNPLLSSIITPSLSWDLKHVLKNYFKYIEHRHWDLTLTLSKIITQVLQIEVWRHEEQHNGLPFLDYQFIAPCLLVLYDIVRNLALNICIPNVMWSLIWCGGRMKFNQQTPNIFRQTNPFWRWACVL